MSGNTYYSYTVIVTYISIGTHNRLYANNNYDIL